MTNPVAIPTGHTVTIDPDARELYFTRKDVVKPSDGWTFPSPREHIVSSNDYIGTRTLEDLIGRALALSPQGNVTIELENNGDWDSDGAKITANHVTIRARDLNGIPPRIHTDGRPGIAIGEGVDDPELFNVDIHGPADPYAPRGAGVAAIADEKRTPPITNLNIEGVRCFNTGEGFLMRHVVGLRMFRPVDKGVYSLKHYPGDGYVMELAQGTSLNYVNNWEIIEPVSWGAGNGCNRVYGLDEVIDTGAQGMCHSFYGNGNCGEGDLIHPAYIDACCNGAMMRCSGDLIGLLSILNRSNAKGTHKTNHPVTTGSLRDCVVLHGQHFQDGRRLNKIFELNRMENVDIRNNIGMYSLEDRSAGGWLSANDVDGWNEDAFLVHDWPYGKNIQSTYVATIAMYCETIGFDLNEVSFSTYKEAQQAAAAWLAERTTNNRRGAYDENVTAKAVNRWVRERVGV